LLFTEKDQTKWFTRSLLDAFEMSLTAQLVWRATYFATRITENATNYATIFGRFLGDTASELFPRGHFNEETSGERAGKDLF